MNCTVKGITESVVTENKKQAERTVKEIRDMSDMEIAELSNTPTAFLTRILKELSPTIDGDPVHILDLNRDKDGNFTMKYKIEGNDTVLETEIRELTDFNTRSSSFSFNKTSLEALYSDYEHVNMFDDFEELALNITNNPEKIMEVADALIAADDYHNNEAQNLVLKDQLTRITDALVEMVPNLNVHINNAGEKNIGKIYTDTGNIYIEKGVGGSKSLMEIYVHELYHAVTHYAITGTSTVTRGITSRIELIRENFLTQTTEADLVRTSGNTLTEEQAGELLDYLTDSKIGLHEFVALSMSNPAIMNQLKSLDVTAKKEQGKQKLFYRLLDAVHSLFQLVARTITKEPKGDDFQRMVFLVSRLHEAHKKPLEAKRLLSIRNLLSIFDPIDRKWSDFLEKQGKKVKDNPSRHIRKPGESKARYVARMTAMAFFDEQAKDIIATSLSLATTKGGSGVFSPEGSFRSTFRDIRKADSTQIDIEREGLISQVIDQQREFRAVHTAQVILQGFTRPLTEVEETAITDVILDTDLEVLFNDDYDFVKLLENNTEISKATRQILNKLENLTDKRSKNFYDAQTSLLANYLINHEDNIALLKNAENIAKKLGTTEENFEVSEEVVALIDELASLKALKKTSKAKRNIITKLLVEENTGLTNLIKFQKGQKHRAEEELFPTPSSRINIIKGYSAQITNQDIEVTTAPISHQRNLEAQGYKLVKTLTKHSADRNISQMGLFVNNRFIMQNFHRVGMRMTDKGRRGTSITESYAKGRDSHPTLRAANDIKRMKERRTAVVEAMYNGEYDPEAVPDDGLISPVFNKVGEVSNFTYGMDKETKIKILEMERKASVIMGRTAASTYDKKKTEEFNNNILKLIEKDAAKNLKPEQRSIIGKNLKEYIKIAKDSPNKEVRNLWKVLPEDVKRQYPDGFTLRRDLMHFYLGYREISITDLPGVRGFFENNPKAYKAIIKYGVQFAEKLWQELVKISKIDIIIRTPGVLIGNVVSNFMLMYVSGYSFKEITALKYQGVKELQTYIKSTTESIKLTAKEDAGIATKEDIRRLNLLRNNMANSPVKDLIDEGYYTTILEELEHSVGSNSGSYFNRLAKKKLKNAPKIFSDGVDLLYITEHTKLFKLIEKATQASDFAARYAQYHLLVEQGAKKEKAINIVRDNFINYNKPNSRFIEWANQMGFVMFTKYFTRIQRVIHRYGKEHPIKVLVSMLAQGYIFGELDTFDDQSLLVKDMGNLFYSPWDHMLRVFTPTSAEAVNWVLNGK